MKLKDNTFIVTSDHAHRAILYDMYTAKKYEIPYEIGKMGNENTLDDKDIEKINSVISDVPVEKTYVENNIGLKTLGHLRLLITNRCNFNCTYCFADHGSYGISLDDMSIETARKTIDYFFKKYDKIYALSFFGGEPLIAIDLIDYVCGYIAENYKDNVPKYSLVTNGSLLNEKTVGVLRKYHIGVVISHDGPQCINDANRKYPDGRGTYELVTDKIKQYRDQLNCTIETTYSSLHEKNDVSRKDLVDYFTNQLNINRVVINDTEIEGNHPKDLEPRINGQIAQINEFFDSNNYTFTDFIAQMTNAFFNLRYTDRFCDAGINEYCVDMKGNIYPCHRYVGKPEYILGTVDTEIDNHAFIEINSKSNSECKACPYKAFCRRCVYSLKYVHGSCEEIKEWVRLYLTRMLTLFMEKPDDYQKIIQKFNEFYEKNHL